METEIQEIPGVGGVSLYIRDYRPADVTSPPVILVIHGLGEHGGRYDHFSEWLVDRGWRVVLIDLRGHGLSGGTRTHVQSFDEYVADIGTVWRHFQFNPQSTVLFAHSMGGLIAIRALEEGLVQPAALVATSPLLGLKMRVNPLKWLLGRMMVQIRPKTRFKNGLDPRNMTRDPLFAEERRNDPLIVRSVTAGWFFAMQHALAQAHADVAKVTIPVLFFRGLADTTTDGDMLGTWLTRTKSPSHELISLPLHVHEVFHETDWRDSMERMMQWLQQLGIGAGARIENVRQIRSRNDASSEHSSN